MILGISYIALIWLVAAILLAVLEAETQGLVSLWFSIGALAASFVALAQISFVIQALVFLVVSLGFLVFLRPFTRKYLKINQAKTNADRLVGQVGEVIQEIKPIKGVGQVKILGQIWSALSVDGSDIPVGSKVKVEEISGVKLMATKM